MFKKLLLPVIFVVLGYGFFVSPEFKEIAAGVAIFLFGMMLLGDGFKVFSGGTLEKILRKATDKLWKSLTFGMVTTAIMQSSSLVSVLSISFMTAGLITLAQGIGIIFGSNLGTTTGAWIIAGIGFKVDIAAYAMPMLVFGVIMVFMKDKTLKGVGYVLAGLGFLFLGIAYMKTGFESVGESINLAEYAMPGMKGLIVYTLIGIGATVVMQSSHATLTLTIAALASGQITYDNALALAIGSNIGTTITAIIGALSANVAGRRLAGAHLIFNLVTGAIAIAFLPQLIQVVAAIADVLGIAPDDYTLKLATFHTVFNLIGVVVMIPFINTLVRILERVFVEKEEVAGISRPVFVKDAALELPDTALEAVVKEVIHLAHNVATIVYHAMNLHRSEVLSDRNIAEVVEASSKDLKTDVRDLYRRRVKPIYSAIVEFSAKAAGSMEPEQAEQLQHLQQAGRALVGAVKVVGEIQPNMARYSSGDNAYMRHEYNEIRIHIAKLLRQIHQIADQPVTDIEKVKSVLAQMRVDMETNDVLANGRLDKYIREGLIDQRMASSLMNDSAFAYDLVQAVIEACEIIFAKLISIEKDISLVDAELQEALRGRETDLDWIIRRRSHDVEQIQAEEGPVAQ